MTMIFNPALFTILNNSFNINAGTFNLMLVTSAFTVSSTTRDFQFRTSVTANEVSGTGYTAGGSAVTVAVANGVPTTLNRTTVTFGSVSWPSSTITARGGIVYKVVGSAATDNLLCYVSFGGADVVSSGGTFQVTFSAPITFQLP